MLVNRPAKAPVSQRQAEAAPQLGYVTDALRALPDTYAKLTQAAPKDPPPPPPPAPPARAQTASVQHMPAGKSELSDREKAAQKAREADIEVKQPKAPAEQRTAPVALVPSAVPADASGAAAPALSENEAWRERHARLKETEVSDRLHSPPSPYALMAGTFIPASLITGISSDLSGVLVAQIRQSVYDTVSGRYLLLPQGTRAIGAYDSAVVYGQERVLIVWQRLILPNGRSLQLEGMPGVDMAGLSGLKDKVNYHLWPLLRAVILSSVLSVGSRVPFGSTQGYNPTLSQEFAQDFAAAANRAGQGIVNRELQRKPTLEVRPGFSFNILVHQDLILQPYQWGVASGR
jgi:type IV secretion system protein VirB10